MNVPDVAVAYLRDRANEKLRRDGKLEYADDAAYVAAVTAEAEAADVEAKLQALADAYRARADVRSAVDAAADEVLNKV